MLSEQVTVYHKDFKKEIVKFPKRRSAVKKCQNVKNVDNVDKKIRFATNAENKSIPASNHDKKYPQKKIKYPQGKKTVFVISPVDNVDN